MIRLALRVKRADAELVLADLLQLAPSGVEEIDLPALDGGEGVVEYAVYGAPGEIPDLPDLQAAAGGALVEVSTSEVPDDWSERWKQFHQPVLVEAPSPAGASSEINPVAGDGRVPALHVRPPWESPTEHAGALEIVIDPAQAFGTGAHATTRLCMELLLEVTATKGPYGGVLDVGAGSGVLAIAATKLGYAPVLALDNDRESVRAILDNAALNGVEIDARRFDLREQALPWLEGDEGKGIVPRAKSDPPGDDRQGQDTPRTLVLANLLRPLLLDLAETMPASNPPARLDLIASGLLREQAHEVAAALADRLELREIDRRERGEWAALYLSRG
jgi:ribosomal protein L11 methyltransferase